VLLGRHGAGEGRKEMITLSSADTGEPLPPGRAESKRSLRYVPNANRGMSARSSIIRARGWLVT